MQNYLINNRPLSLFQNLSEDLKFNPAKNYLFDLSCLGILDISGDKALEFLQGQVTSDVNKMQDKQLLPGAICNLKGRILTLFQGCKYQGLKLILPGDLLADTQKSLTPAAMLSRVQLAVNPEYFVLGYYCQNPQDLTLDPEIPCFQYYLPDANPNQLFLIMANAEQKTALTEQFSAAMQFRGSLAWHTLTLLHKDLSIYPETRGEFLPHRLDLQLSEYLSFNKGCYKGQEIIARTHYRATLKHELALFIIESEKPLHSCQKIFAGESDKEIGEIVDYSPINAKEFIIAATVLKDRPEGLRIG